VVKPFDTSLYPFTSRWFDRGGGLRMHYVDEGPRDGQGKPVGPPILFLHGNPSWSFYFRNLIMALRDSHRCIALDHIGMGLSDKPNDKAYSYTLEQRIEDVQLFVDKLRLKQPLTLIVHDWGGMIGMGWAVRQPRQVARLVLLNTAAFPMPRSKSLPLALGLTRTPVGTLLVRGLNAFSWTATRVGCKRKAMSRAVAQAYTAPYDSWATRIATLRFVQDIPVSRDHPTYGMVQHVGDQVMLFHNTPTLIVWGGKDFVFDAPFLATWRKLLPNAHVHYLADAGHYVLEDAADEVVPLIGEFVRTGQVSQA